MSKRKYHHNSKLPKNYYNYFDLCKIEGIETNRAKNAVKDKGAEGIRYIEEFKPIEHLFEVFEKPIQGRIVNSYGIKRRYYDDWKLTGELPKIQTGRPPLDGMAELKATVPQKLKDDMIKARDKANSMSVVKVTLSDMVSVALQEYLQRRPQFINLEEKDE